MKILIDALKIMRDDLYSLKEPLKDMLIFVGAVSVLIGVFILLVYTVSNYPLETLGALWGVSFAVWVGIAISKALD
jgi:hypothetical protein